MVNFREQVVTNRDLANDLRDQAEALTADLRSGNGPLMQRLRQIISEKGLHLDEIVLVEGADDFLDHYIGVLVSRDAGAIEFSLDCSNTDKEHAVLVSWQAADSVHAERIAAGRDLLERRRPRER